MTSPIQFHLPARRQFGCLSRCGTLLLLAFAIPLVLLLAIRNSLPALVDYLDQFETHSLVDLALDETRTLDGLTLRLDRIDSHIDGSFDATIAVLIGRLPVRSVDLSLNLSPDGSATVAPLPRGYALRLISASRQSIRLQIFYPIKEN